eukprot:TRINITY_DN10630_c0_g1_i1.p1 TRINITY_DN10630_c0_g1~~TRINITY_DN10630_c0_g1_i1.p1  ORF type:complete len:751 (+),score=112.75 TRINITY_DN10630_c0_g1_i1:118-2370(+)
MAMDIQHTQPFDYSYRDSLLSQVSDHEELSPQRQPSRQRTISMRSNDSRAGNDDDDTALLINTYHNTVSHSRVQRIFIRYCSWLTAWVADDWLVLTVLGVLIALIGFALDYAINSLHQLRAEITTGLNPVAEYVTWLTFSLFCILLATALTHFLSADAIGSGIPQMKSILQGTQLRGYLSLKTLAAKVLGLTFAEGSGLPIGKEGPFVHIASIVMQQISRLFPKISANESRRLELLAAACAVGVASNFGAPIGGVLFSIEVTSTYFAVRNYWRGFYASVIGAFVFRLLAVVIANEKTITALFTTEFDAYPFDLWEMLAFILLGALCGLLSSLFILLHRKIIEGERHYSQPGKMLHFLNRSRYFYPALVTFLIATITFPHVFGSYMGLVQRTEIDHLFTTKPLRCVEEWSHQDVLSSLALFVILKFGLTALAITLPIPAGVFVPVFVLGGALGRFFGEAMNLIFPDGLIGDQADAGPPLPLDNGCEWTTVSHIVPGGYAVVGAAALAGGITHTISTSVIVFELTGQIHHILPVMVAVLISNAVCQSLSPSIYDSIIQLRGMPYLPDLRRGQAYKQTVESIMRRDATCLSLHCSYGKINRLLRNSHLPHFPLVDNLTNMALIGSVHRRVLRELLTDQVDALMAKQLSPDELATARRELLRETVDLTGVPIDPSPFQLVAQTSLYKVHVLFSTLGVSTAYVTNMGKLVGVIGMTEVRAAIISQNRRRFEAHNSNRLHPREMVHFVEERASDDS